MKTEPWIPGTRADNRLLPLACQAHKRAPRLIEAVSVRARTVVRKLPHEPGTMHNPKTKAPSQSHLTARQQNEQKGQTKQNGQTCPCAPFRGRLHASDRVTTPSVDLGPRSRPPASSRCASLRGCKPDRGCV
eukprot:UN4618